MIKNAESLRKTVISPSPAPSLPSPAPWPGPPRLSPLPSMSVYGGASMLANGTQIIRRWCTEPWHKTQPQWKLWREWSRKWWNDDKMVHVETHSLSKNQCRKSKPKRPKTPTPTLNPKPSNPKPLSPFLSRDCNNPWAPNPETLNSKALNPKTTDLRKEPPGSWNNANFEGLAQDAPW